MIDINPILLRQGNSALPFQFLRGYDMALYQIVLVDRKYRRQNMKKLTAAFRVLMQNDDDAILTIDKEERDGAVYYTATIERREGG